MKTKIEYVDTSKAGLQTFVIDHEDVLPCPFCGEKEPNVDFKYVSYEDGNCSYEGYVKCYNHECTAKICGYERDNEESRKVKEPYEARLVRSAIKKWNNRVKQ